jgi:cAMP-dependent protein kinase regulator
MDPYERLQIADALKSIKCTKGEYVVKQVLLLVFIIYKGEEGDIFFMVETGELEAFVEKNPGDLPVSVMKYKSEMFFGELALLKN